MSGKIYDVIVIGGGPGGYSSAISAAKEGLSVLLFEGEAIGGTCLNVGCIPTKYLLDKAAAMEKIRALTDKKIFKDAGLYSFKKIQIGREEVIKKLVGGVEYLLKANKVDVIRGFATMKEPLKVECNGTVYEGKNVILATGSESAKIPIPGAEYTINSTQALALTKVPKRLVVIGGGVIGMELASAFHSFGSEVTVIEVIPELFPAEDKKAVSYMQKELKKRGIRILLGTKVKVIEKAGKSFRVFYEGEEPEETYADVVLMATGRRPKYTGIDVEALGIATTAKGEIQVDEFMQTTVPHIYAIGDVAGGYQLAHAAYAEGEAAVGRILGKNEPVDLMTMPRCIYTMPAFAAVGTTEAKAKVKGINAVTGTFSYTGNGMALAEGAEGVVQVVMDADSKTTLGIQIVGEGAPELISFATLAVKNQMTIDEWEKLIVAHPSLSEMVKEAALDCFGKSVHGAVR